MPQRQDDPEARVRPPGLGRRGTRGLELAENLVYGGIAVFRVGSALLLLVIAGKTTRGVVSDFTPTPLLEVLDVLLLVFIVVELLFALRITVERRQLVAEPFLLVGIIASIKEIVVAALDAKAVRGTDQAAFDDAMLEIGVLAAVVVLLSLATFLVRRKEREPSEEADGEQ